MRNPFRRRQTPTPKTDLLASEVDDIFTEIDSLVGDELLGRCQDLAVALSGGRRVGRIEVDGSRGSVRIVCADRTVVAATAGLDTAAQIAAMVVLEPTVVRAGRPRRDGIMLLFHSPSWSYGIDVVPAQG